MPTNDELVPIYTDWVNRYLSKAPNYKPIDDICNELRDYRLVAKLIQVVVPDNANSPQFTSHLSRVNTNIDGLNVCLQYLALAGVESGKVTSRDIDTGQLAAVLQLLYALSTFKQQIRQKKKEERLEKAAASTNIMPPSTASKLPSPLRPVTTTQASNVVAPSSGSKLLQPTRIAQSRDKQTVSPGRNPGAGSLRPPNTNLRPASRGNGNNNGSTLSSSNGSSIASSSTYQSISDANTPQKSKATSTSSHLKPASSTANLKTPSLVKPRQIQAPAKSQLTPKTAITKPSALKPPAASAQAADSTNQSKMLKLKLFGGKEKDKKDVTPLSSPAPIKKASNLAAPKTSGLAKPKVTSELKAPSRIAAPKKKETQHVQFRAPTIRPPTAASADYAEKKRTSKSSEEDSAYAGFGSTSPASSTQSSMSLQSTSSKGSHEAECQAAPVVEEKPSTPETVMKRRGSDSQDKPTMAVKGMSSRLPSTAEKKEPEVEPETPKSDMPEAKKALPSPTVGVVSPMLSQRRVEAIEPQNLKPAPPPIECEPSSSTKPAEKKAPPVPCRSGSRVETTFECTPPAMPPIRQPPAYQQLVEQGRIRSSRLGQFVDSSTSEDSLDSVSTTIRIQPSGYTSEGNTLDRNERARTVEPSGYISEGGIAIYEKMQARLREYRDSMRRGHLDYNDSFEDSSSISSGISENFDDISTDDLSGTDHPMATVAAAYGKLGDYQHFTRNTLKGPRSSSSTIDSRAKRIAEQENIHQLLQQCRTSQRGAACQPLRSPGYATYGPQLALSADGDTLSVHSRSSLRVSSKRQDQPLPSFGGYHSLDRKSHLSEYYRENSPNRLGIFDRTAMAALLSPRRVPQPPPDSMQRHSVSASRASLNAMSGMSRSMVLLESAAAAASPAPRSRRGASPRHQQRLPLSVASPANHKGSLSARGAQNSERIYANFRDGIHLHRLADELSPSHALTKSEGADISGSQASLTSATCNSLGDKYEADIRKMARELEGYRHTISKLTRKQEDYSHVMEMFQNKLSQLSKQVDKSQLKPDDINKLRQEIDQLRLVSGRLAQGGDAKKGIEGAGELLRQPSLESVASLASHRSSMSSSSKSSRTDKSSLNSFGKTKKSWIRSSLTKAFSKKKNKNGGTSDTESSPHHALNTISGSSSRLDEVEVDELKKKLEDRDVALTDIRLDALDKAREVDILRETVNRLKHENKQLKSDMSRLLAGRGSRASSQASIPMLGDEEPVYEAPPSSASGSYSSKRSSGCNSVKLTVNVDLRGTISNAICPDNEIIIGFLAIPGKEVTWEELDQQIFSLFEAYIARIDPDHHLGLHCSESVIGYQMGDVVREKGAIPPTQVPGDVLTPTTTVRMFLRGAAQHAVDSLVLECLFPRTMLEQLLKFLLSHRRLVLSGATGIGKSNLARQLAAYLSVRIGLDRNGVVDVKIPEDTSDKGIVKVEKQLESLLRSPDPTVVLIDNIPRHRIAFVSSVFSSVELSHDDGPFVICTVNRACQLPEMQVHHNFKMFLLTNRMDGVKGFMARFLRRRIIEAEFRLSRQTPPELVRVIQFLPIVLQAVNSFIEKANSLDVTIGPRIFLQCPLGVEESRTWFVRLWNQNIIPYMVKVAREGVKVLGRCGSFEDPTDIVCEHWPWLDGPSGEECLNRLSIKETIGQSMPKQPFNPLDTLIRLQASRNAAIDNV
ncbi:hypothetical protein Y032_0335g2869 [Ancylostoma ceylanicum]|uniref:Calponin-homology (CH) domain-containing protein n=2 Tax=Ancylostoma TaxID=29169 RepID=A0A016RZP1_9BILA|nr:hypothetical protein Y032_0335g2869 [Ancylostoma ceylanicum]